METEYECEYCGSILWDDQNVIFIDRSFMPYGAVFCDDECLLHYLEAYEGELKDIEPAKETCEYCTFDGDHGKSFMFQLGFSNEEMVICKHHGHYYISCTTNDISDKINGIQERNSKDINFCPNCGRRLK
ncbi:hypothetical protein [Lactobacillus gasseri]|jgi:DNA-directed RNA polymerase subunit RPC12/RpoP|uniref:Uncharacterized protein n=1 Tax=Lactobacillus gasseri TaxID=1596 RepID=A0AB33C9S1_LACGS|nr:hypothetical protein [Lactobacillus gasseri]ART99196.1 hypothetical protein CCE30_10025 [Lactobacillus gasseri]RBQ00727.1 hypothetical protein C3745_07350 [Lactobacillus gasseri]